MNVLLSRFLIDTGATEHLTNSKLIFKSYKEQKDEILCANKNANANLKSEGVGIVEIFINNNKVLKLDNAICAENLSENLLSLRKFTDLGQAFIRNQIGSSNSKLIK